LWCADDPAHSDLSMPAIARLGPARIAVSTAGQSPALAARLRQIFEAQLGERFGRFVEALGALRAELRREEPSVQARHARLRAAADQLDLTVTARYPDWFRD
jgi:siroheme synthase (precorrin-2 oxidase/ferrochelatase)